jgi:inner membrane protein involved in colicin E2 resistance
MPGPDERSLLLYSGMFLFSSLMIAGYVAFAARGSGRRRALLAAISFAVSYAIFWVILRREP